MRTTHRLVCPSLALSGLALLLAPGVSARPDGFAATCSGCHYGTLSDGSPTPPPEVTATANQSRVEPGGQVEFTVSVTSRWTAGVAAGFLILGDEAAGGTFTPAEEGTGNVGLTPGEMLGHTLGHTKSRPLVDKATTFIASWMAPDTPGSYEFEVFGVITDDGDGMDETDAEEEKNDSVGRTTVTVGVGCDLATFFKDGDMDGYGGDALQACEQPEGYVTQDGDCKDDDAEVHPGAVELCSFQDENCDGDPMAPPPFFGDADGDGYGTSSDLMVAGCEPPEGYVAEMGDCKPDDPAIHPGAVEVAGNNVDDNCNGEIDEATAAPTPPSSAAPPSAGGAPALPPAGGAPALPTLGSASPATPTAPAPSPTDSSQLPVPTGAPAPGIAVNETPENETGGCVVAPRFQRSQTHGPWLALVALLLASGLRRRRSRPRIRLGESNKTRSL